MVGAGVGALGAKRLGRAAHTALAASCSTWGVWRTRMRVSAGLGRVRLRLGRVRLRLGRRQTQGKAPVPPRCKPPAAFRSAAIGPTCRRAHGHAQQQRYDHCPVHACSAPARRSSISSESPHSRIDCCTVCSGRRDRLCDPVYVLCCVPRRRDYMQDRTSLPLSPLPSRAPWPGATLPPAAQVRAVMPATVRTRRLVPLAAGAEQCQSATSPAATAIAPPAVQLPCKAPSRRRLAAQGGQCPHPPFPSMPEPLVCVCPLPAAACQGLPAG